MTFVTYCTVLTGDIAWESEWQALPALQATLSSIWGMSLFTFMPEFNSMWNKEIEIDENKAMIQMRKIEDRKITLEVERKRENKSLELVKVIISIVNAR